MGRRANDAHVDMNEEFLLDLLPLNFGSFLKSTTMFQFMLKPQAAGGTGRLDSADSSDVYKKLQTSVVAF